MLTTTEAAELLNVTQARVRQMVLAGRLPAQKMGRDLFIHESDLKLVADRKPGRPPLKTDAKTSNVRNGRQRAKKKGVK